MINWLTAHAHWFAFGAAFVGLVVLGTWRETVLSQRKRAALRPYLSRPCRGIRWHRRFPGVPHDDIRRFLRGFAECFRVAPHQATGFGPDDRPFEVWEAACVGGLLDIDTDEELYDWGTELEAEYGLALVRQAAWGPEITFAEIFALTRSAG